LGHDWLRSAECIWDFKNGRLTYCGTDIPLVTGQRANVRRINATKRLVPPAQSQVNVQVKFVLNSIPANETGWAIEPAEMKEEATLSVFRGAERCGSLVFDEAPCSIQPCQPTPTEALTDRRSSTESTDFGAGVMHNGPRRLYVRSFLAHHGEKCVIDTYIELLSMCFFSFFSFMPQFVVCLSDNFHES